MNIPKVLDIVVKSDLCIGCGLCVYKCPNKALSMEWDKLGFLTPLLNGKCDSNGLCIDVCPFSPNPKNEVKTEYEISKLFLKDAHDEHPKIGRYISIYAGYAPEFRLSSSSGGLATYLFTELLDRRIVDYVFSVKESNITGKHYEYAVSSNKEEILNASKTKYYPVTLGTIMPKIHELNGKVAIVGVACFIKAIRLAQHEEPALKDKIPFLAGIICGGVKSRFFTEYLASKTGVEKQNIQQPQFRIKDTESAADDYSYGCYDKADNQSKFIKMRSVGDMWGTGLFKANACDFCDDVTTELADISLGDAWLEPYNKDGQGTSVVVTRSSIAEKIIHDGIINGKLKLESLNLERFLASQQGSFNHRHTGLSVRIKEAKRKNKKLPPKRFGNEKTTIDFKIVQKIRMIVRRKSLEIWDRYPNAAIFEQSIKNYLKLLTLATRINHKCRAFKRRINYWH